ncbi:hypothetical protein EKK58_09165 [Candidatus Dependentiae bacterium]|nr:MAG: hypothetical protein EKK58_09165 [Candidatus Dependentiae bacterium]
MRDGHTAAVQQSDEMFCSDCGLRWDVNDPDPPECTAAIPQDVAFLFRSLFAAEQFHPKIARVLNNQTKKRYKQWKMERLNGFENRREAISEA